MSLDTTSPRSRRALLAGSLGAMVAMVAQAIGRPLPAVAANPVLLNQNNTGFTKLTNFDTSVELAPGDSGLLARSSVTNYAGAIASFEGSGAGTGLYATTAGYSTQIAVDAKALDGFGEGIAVRARTKNGVGLHAEAAGGAAIVAEGLTEFSRSGRASFSAGQASRTLKPGRITARTLVVATVQGAVPGVWVLGVTVSVPKQQVTVRLNKPAPRSLVVGWFVVN